MQFAPDYVVQAIFYIVLLEQMMRSVDPSVSFHVCFLSVSFILILLITSVECVFLCCRGRNYVVNGNRHCTIVVYFALIEKTGILIYALKIFKII